MKKILLTAIILVFCLSGVANAGDWVLWKHSNANYLDNWFIEEAFSSYELCIISCNEKLNLGPVLPSNFQRYGNGFKIKNEDGSTAWLEFLCLPGTVDPRK